MDATELTRALACLADPVRRGILEVLAGGERTAGDIVKVIAAEAGISQPAVSQHLAVLRGAGWVRVRPQGARRFYRLEAEPLRSVDDWLDGLRGRRGN